MAEVYEDAAIYDLAFSWRDIPAECRFMLAAAEGVLGRPVATAAELACGPGRHARYLATEAGVEAHGIDAQAEMTAYATAQPGGDRVTWHTGDMRAYRLPGPVDLQFCLMDSLAHMLTLDDLLGFYESAAANAAPGGLLLIEQSHPRDAIGDEDAEPGASPEWSIGDETGRHVVHARWGSPDDTFDTITQTAVLHVQLEYEVDGALARTIEAEVPSRLWLCGEAEAAIRASGAWEIVGRFGAMQDVPLTDGPPAYRMVHLLRRR